MSSIDDSRYFSALGAAFVKGRLPETRVLRDDEAVLARGVAAGLRLHKFKRNQELPRVRRVLGALRGIVPQTLLDVGSGRGTFLWPLLDAFPTLGVTAIDKDPRRARDLGAVTTGGVDRLTALCVDATALPFADRSFDVVTLLEVLEHVPDAPRALAEAVRVAERFIVVTVPSREDDNPEHIHLFDSRSLRALFTNAGAASVHVEYLRGHILAVAHSR